MCCVYCHCSLNQGGRRAFNLTVSLSACFPVWFPGFIQYINLCYNKVLFKRKVRSLRQVKCGCLCVLPCTDRVQMCALVFGPVAGVAEGLEAAGMLADVRFLSCVAPQVDLQVLQT